MTNPTPPRDDAPETIWIRKHREEWDWSEGGVFDLYQRDLNCVQVEYRRADHPARVGAIPADGSTIEAMRAALMDTPAGRAMVNAGDTKLYWMNEGDVNASILAALLPTEAGAEPVAWRSVERKFYRSEWELSKLLEARNGGMLTDEGEAWTYVYSHKDGTGGEYDLLRRREPATPPAAPTDNTSLVERLKFEAEAMQKAVSGESVNGTFHAQNWSDKPHRVVYDACRLIEEAAAALRREAPQAVTVDRIAQIIRTVDGDNTMGAAELAEHIHRALAGERG